MQGFPLMLNWYVVHRRTKRLPPVAQAFKDFLLQDGAALIEQALGRVRKPHARAGRSGRTQDRSDRDQTQPALAPRVLARAHLAAAFRAAACSTSISAALGPEDDGVRR